jgi:hypothetical protein
MNCPKCGDPSTRIVETVRVAQGLRRHRICNRPKCRRKFRTLERIEEWDHTIQNYVPTPEALAHSNVIPLQQQQQSNFAAKSVAPKGFVARLSDEFPSGIALEAHPLLVQWWNESRRSKHKGNATWTEAAWTASLKRVAALPHWQQVLLAQAGVEHGWQALKPEYVKEELAKPTAAGRPMPKDPAMLAALEQWPEQTA